jgi:uncharacterized damage-inducible protein DinB
MMGRVTWRAPKPTVPVDEPLVGGDRTILEGFLAWHRHTLLNLCADLTAEQLAARPLETTNLSLLGLVRHMAKVERTWFRERVCGERLEPLYDASLGKDADFEDLDPVRAEADYSRLVEEMRLSDAAVADLPFDHTFELRGEPHSLRLVYVHLATEYARHNGHGDLVRQALDGATGR